jgi:SAM-dependent methyltransferase
VPSSSLEAAYVVTQAVLRLEPRRILDLGMGTGKFGFLLREQHDFAKDRKELWITGVEGYEAYVGDHQRLVYDEIVIDDIVRFVFAYDGEPFDVALLLDVIEHFEPDAAVEMVNRALAVAGVAVIATPSYFHAQEIARNPLETHRSWWPKRSLVELGRRCKAGVRVRTTDSTNVAVLSRSASLEGVFDSTVRGRVAALRRVAVPDHLWFRIGGRTGPTIVGDGRHRRGARREATKCSPSTKTRVEEPLDRGRLDE